MAQLLITGCFATPTPIRRTRKETCDSHVGVLFGGSGVPMSSFV